MDPNASSCRLSNCRNKHCTERHVSNATIISNGQSVSVVSVVDNRKALHICGTANENVSTPTKPVTCAHRKPSSCLTPFGRGRGGRPGEGLQRGTGSATRWSRLTEIRSRLSAFCNSAMRLRLRNPVFLGIRASFVDEPHRRVPRLRAFAHDRTTAICTDTDTSSYSSGVARRSIGKNALACSQCAEGRREAGSIV